MSYTDREINQPLPHTHVEVIGETGNFYVDRYALTETLSSKDYFAASVVSNEAIDTRHTRYSWYGSESDDVSDLEHALFKVSTPGDLKPGGGLYDMLILNQDVPELVARTDRDTYIHAHDLQKQCDQVGDMYKNWSWKNPGQRRTLRAEAIHVKSVMDEYGSLLDKVIEETQDITKPKRGLER